MKKRERTSSSVRATTALVWLAALAGACGGTASTAPIQIGSESHFLAYCEQSCGGGFECIGGICTRSCLIDATSCADLGAVVECTNESVEPGAVAVCDASCGGDSDCSSLGAGYECSAGFCRYTGSSALGEGAGRCPEPDANGYVTLESQADVDALAGCRAIRGNLDIRPFEGADLRPLGALTRVTGTLRIGDPFSEFAVPTFPSLDGLESIRELESLELRGVLAQSLRGLRGLRRFLPAQPGSRSGLVDIADAPELTDLRGLRNLAGLTSLRLAAIPKLETLRDLRIPAEVESLRVSGVPLTSLAGLEALTAVRDPAGSLEFDGTALTSLQGLEQLTHVEGALIIATNWSLTDVSALRSLESVGALNIGVNVSLEVVPELPSLSRLQAIYLHSNPRLVQFPSFPSIRHLTNIEIMYNSSLERLPFLSTIESAEVVRIEENGLVELDLSALNSVSQRLRITHNWRLPSADFHLSPSLSAAFVKIAANMDDANRISPCPWPNDGECDSHPFNNLCAPRTDADCPRGY